MLTRRDRRRFLPTPPTRAALEWRGEDADDLRAETRAAAVLVAAAAVIVVVRPSVVRRREEPSLYPAGRRRSAFWE